MSELENNNTIFFTKSIREAIGIVINEWQGKKRIDIRTYIPVIGEEGLVPTKKGISLDIDLYKQLLDGIRELGNVMSREKVVAQIRKSEKEEVRLSITSFHGNTLIDLRSYILFESDDTELKPTKKGISLNVDLYPKLLEALESLEPFVKSIT